MIACLRGELVAKSRDRLVVDVGGVGYEVYFSASNFERLPDLGHPVFLHIHTHVREDAIILFGFLELDEKEMFLLLTSVSGIGPKLALTILAGIEPAELCRTLMAEDVYRLTKLPGIGKKTAERLCLELKDKVQKLSVGNDGGAVVASLRRVDPEDPFSADVISALTNLGYTPLRAREAVLAVRRQNTDEVYKAMSLEELLRYALRSLA
ncbi:MAG: Holliday junction DNA helicase RuvA [Deltaproteobacteria bacterium RIFOXYD12_FULL_50_9]|nr:MAG: Holliday junction DNA helicase RuvA [Deltaproteobacteria bacterium RIFOXYD12_FULL_50_9]